MTRRPLLSLLSCSNTLHVRPKSNLWVRSEPPTAQLSCDSSGLPAESCSPHSPWLMSSTRYCQEPLPPFCSRRHRWNAPPNTLGGGEGRDADFILGCGQGAHPAGGINDLQTLQEGSGCHPEPSRAWKGSSPCTQHQS